MDRIGIFLDPDGLKTIARVIDEDDLLYVTSKKVCTHGYWDQNNVRFEEIFLLKTGYSKDRFLNWIKDLKDFPAGVQLEMF